VNLAGKNLAKVDLAGADLSGADLSGSNLSLAKLQGINLKDAKLVATKFRNAKLLGANLKQANLEGADFMGANMVSANLQYVQASAADFRRIKGNGIDLFGADLTGSKFQGANLRAANLTKSNRTDSQFNGATVKGAIYDSPNDPGKDGFSIRSKAFSDNDPIPKSYSCGGISPPLEWSRIPAGTKSFVLLIEDLDFKYMDTSLPYGNWAIFNIPASVTSLNSGASSALPEGVLNAANDTVIGLVYSGAKPEASFGYNAPCPPVFGEKHRFKISLWALNATLSPFAFDYEWKDFGFKFAYSWVIPRVLEGTDPKYQNLSQMVLGKATMIGTVVK
jgi:Raf kinase inhibitor-like YbhB/YbcL family protein